MAGGFSFLVLKGLLKFYHKQQQYRFHFCFFFAGARWLGGSVFSCWRACWNCTTSNSNSGAKFSEPSSTSTKPIGRTNRDQPEPLLNETTRVLSMAINSEEWLLVQLNFWTLYIVLCALKTGCKLNSSRSERNELLSRTKSTLWQLNDNLMIAH